MSVARFKRTFASWIAIGACFASFSESARTSAANASFSTAFVTTPNEAASSAVRRLPNITSSFAFAWPRSRTSLWLPPAPGTRPRLTSVCPNLARFAAIRKSHARASSRPPPKQWPLIAATVGLGKLASRRKTSCERREDRHTLNAFETSVKEVKSAPALNARSPAPMITTHRTASSACSSPRARSKSSKNPGVRVFRESARLIVIVATCVAESFAIKRVPCVIISRSLRCS